MLLPFVDRNLILTGYTGPDQPRIGQQAAERLRMRFVNVDLQLETRLDAPLDVFRARYGEARLKTAEAELMSEIQLYRGVVLRVSGETLLRAENAKRLAATGPIICLTVALGAALRRLHLAMGARYHDPNERALAVGQLRREWDVRKLPHVHQLDVTRLTHDEIVEAVVTQWTWLVMDAG